MANQVIIFPRGQLEPLDRDRMEQAGIVAVEADEPAAVVTVIPAAPLATSNDIALAALEAVVASGVSSVAAAFTKELVRRIRDREVPNA